MIYVMPFVVGVLSYALFVILTFGLIITSEGFGGFQEFISDNIPSKISSSYIVEIVVLLILALIFLKIYFLRRKNIKKGCIQDKLVPLKKIILNSILFSLIIIFSFSFIFEAIRFEETDDRTIKLNDIQMTYDKNIWEKDKDKESENQKVICHDNSSITLNVSKSYQTLDTIVNDTKKNYEKKGYLILENPYEETLNDNTWLKLVYKNNDNITLQLFYVTNDNLYTFTYKTSEDLYFMELPEVINVYNTLDLLNKKN